MNETNQRPIERSAVDEARALRRRLWEAGGGDLDALCQSVQRVQREPGRRVRTLAESARLEAERRADRIAG